MLHIDVDPDGTLGPAQLETGPVVPDPVARYLCCDASVQVMTYLHGRLIGINPAERTPNRASRRYLARRDQGCTHPLCGQTLWLHAHHIGSGSTAGKPSPTNLVLLCPFHHRALHHGEFSIDGDPEAGTLRFLDRSANPSTLPTSTHPATTRPATDPTASPFAPPYGERFTAHVFTWN